MQHVELWPLFNNRFHYKRNFDANGVPEAVAMALARCLQPLKLMAEPEYWGENDITLVNYFVHTFHALDRLQKSVARTRGNDDRPIYVAEHNDHIYFHTGLITANMEPIYARFPKCIGERAKPNQYFISDGSNMSHFLLNTHMKRYCNPLPTACCYFDDYSHMVMDTTKPIDVNLMHIYDENWERVCKALYSDAPENDPTLKDRMRNDALVKLNGALTMALHRVRANYRTAIPQYYRSQMQLLLPLYLKGNEEADLVLTIARQEYNPPQAGKFSYAASTVLTMAMAYQNARLIARPEKDWLMAPAKINDDEME